jgi:CRP-like cAMP-binding protein
LNTGEVVGEVSLLDSRPPTATITAISKAVLLAVPRDALMTKLNTDSDFASRFYRSLAVFLAHRLRTTYNRFGFGKTQPLDETEEYEDELSPELLDTVHMARVRFDHALQRLMTE